MVAYFKAMKSRCCVNGFEVIVSSSQGFFGTLYLHSHNTSVGFVCSHCAIYPCSIWSLQSTIDTTKPLRNAHTWVVFCQEVVLFQFGHFEQNNFGIGFGYGCILVAELSPPTQQGVGVNKLCFKISL